MAEPFREGWAGNCSGKTTVAVTACGVGERLQNICGAVPWHVKSCRLFPESQHCISLFSVIYFVSVRGTAQIDLQLGCTPTFSGQMLVCSVKQLSDQKAP